MGASNRETAAQLIEAVRQELQEGRVPWKRGWRSLRPEGRPIRANGAVYRGANAWLLSIAAAVQGYDSRLWATMRQWAAWGGSIKGQKATPVALWKEFRLKAAAGLEEGDDGRRLLLRKYAVFNRAQVTPTDADAGLRIPARLAALDAPADPLPDAPAAVAAAEEIAREYAVERGGPLTEWRGDQAFYHPVQDRVVMPERASFESAGTLYATWFHELAHSTGHPGRLDRGLGRTLAPFGSPDYSREELVAELASVLITAAAGLEPDIGNAAAYCRGWSKALTDDPGAFLWAAGRAEAAAALVTGEEIDREEKIDED